MKKFLGIMLLLLALIVFFIMGTLQREAAQLMPSAPLVFGWGKYFVAVPLAVFAIKLLKRKKSNEVVD